MNIIDQKKPRVFTIVINWNQLNLTLECLESLSQSIYPNNTIVVVDNGSTDESPKSINDRFPLLTLIECGENLGYSEGNNRGIEFALREGADYIFLLNNDTIVDPHMLSKLVDVAESDPTIGITGPTMFYMDPQDILWGGENWIDWRKANTVRSAMGAKINLLLPENMEPRSTDYIDSCAILIKREVIEKIGMMDCKYFINFDDLDLNTRARKAGFRVMYVPTAVMWHKVSAAMGLASPATTYYMTRNSLLFFLTHGPGPWKYIELLQILARCVRTISAWSIKSNYRTEIYRRKRDANLMALRDFFQGRYGKMGPDVVRVCYGK
jgi:GT2 family glycosyltransferase